MFGCGIKVFNLSNNTLEEIERQGLSFFHDATETREYGDPQSNYSNYSYQPWQETPFQENEDNTIFWPGLNCAETEGLEKDLSEKISLAAKTKRSYYTSHYEGKLLVIPNLGIVVYSYIE